MTIPFQTGRYSVRFAACPADVVACQRLRHMCFFDAPGRDKDPFDARCRHVMVHASMARLVATMRLSAGPVTAGYAAQFYDVSALHALDVPMLEVGRFCIAPDVQDADVLRIAWGALTSYVDGLGVQILFGCASFAGSDPALYGRVLARLARYVGPHDLRPTPRVSTQPLASVVPAGCAPLPALLRTYLAMGGWVGSDLIIDPKMQTMHVFTCLEIAKIPAARARSLRALAQEAALS